MVSAVFNSRVFHPRVNILIVLSNNYWFRLVVMLPTRRFVGTPEEAGDGAKCSIEGFIDQ